MPGFVNEDKTFWIKPMLPCAPRYPGFGDVRPILLGCVRGFFNADPMAIKEPPDRANANPQTALTKSRTVLLQ